MRQQIPRGCAAPSDKVYGKLISTKASARENGDVSLAIKYFRFTVWRACL